MGVADRALLRYAGLMAGRTRSGAALERLLSDHLRLPVRIRPLTGRWLEIDPAERTRLGRTGANARLGAGATVGSRVWDVESCFTLEFGPLAYADHLSLLPGGGRHAPAAALTRLFAGETLEFRLELRIRAAEVPRLKVSAREGARLGWTAFLRTSDAAAAPGVVRIAPRHTGPARPERTPGAATCDSSAESWVPPAGSRWSGRRRPSRCPASGGPCTSMTTQPSARFESSHFE
jgi:predicted component of type VI protein secretion system